MASKQPFPGLEIEENMPQQHREWTVQRVAWFFLYGLLGAVILGLLGEGPLSEARLQGEGGRVVMEYNRFMRHRAADRFRILLPPAGATVQVRLDAAYLSALEIEKITPQPQRVTAEPDAVLFVFSARGERPTSVEVHVKPQRFGRLHGWIEVAGGARRSFSQFVYP